MQHLEATWVDTHWAEHSNLPPADSAGPSRRAGKDWKIPRFQKCQSQFCGKSHGTISGRDILTFCRWFYKLVRSIGVLSGIATHDSLGMKPYYHCVMISQIPFPRKLQKNRRGIPGIGLFSNNPITVNCLMSDISPRRYFQFSHSISITSHELAHWIHYWHSLSIHTHIHFSLVY